MNLAGGMCMGEELYLITRVWLKMNPVGGEWKTER